MGNTGIYIALSLFFFFIFLIESFLRGRPKPDKFLQYSSQPENRPRMEKLVGKVTYVRIPKLGINISLGASLVTELDDPG